MVSPYEKYSEYLQMQYKKVERNLFWRRMPYLCLGCQRTCLSCNSDPSAKNLGCVSSGVVDLNVGF